MRSSHARRSLIHPSVHVATNSRRESRSLANCIQRALCIENKVCRTVGERRRQRRRQRRRRRRTRTARETQRLKERKRNTVCVEPSLTPDASDASPMVEKVEGETLGRCMAHDAAALRVLFARFFCRVYVQLRVENAAASCK